MCAAMAKPVLVLVPGFMLDSALWDRFLPLFRDRFTLLPLEPVEGESLRAIAENLLAQCPEHSVLLGFSMGGYIAREMMALAPERFAALVLVATAMRPDNPAHANARKVAVDALRNGAPFRGMSYAALKASLHPNHATPEMLEHLHAMGIRLGRDVFIRQSLLERITTPANSSAIACPALVVAAEDDRLRSLEEVRELADTLPNATFKTIADCGHMIPLEQPERLAALMLEWLDDVSVAH